MKRTLFFFILVSLTLIQSINSQSKVFALGFEGIHFPDFSYTKDSIQDLNCNLWCSSGSNSEYSYFLDDLKSHGVLFSLFMPKWSQTRAWGQQTVYQAELTDINGNTIPKYKYNNHWSKGIDLTDNSVFGNGERVRYYQAIPNNPSPGYVLSGADENFEPVGSIIWWETNKKYEYWRTESDTLNRWYIMPRMRIDSAFARNNPNVNVARIEIYSYDSSKVREVVLKCQNFYDLLGNYNGHFIEEYNFFGNNELEVSADNFNGLNKGRNYNEGPIPESCKVDFKIYWYETTNLWIDYVKIEDKYAHDLFNGQNNDSLLDEMGEF